ncbi:MAG: MarR family transcriptional regulator [Betaproteobacteria bacterium]|nr:MarR family transcriptional regulator [Betaproteobacteria bacterium]
MDFLPLLRELVRTYQALDTFSGQHIRKLGLTVSQFDVIATLGNTPGMSCRDIGEKTLMVKGTLTGVLSRLEKKQLITRQENPNDKRSVLVQLTPAGQRLFERIFPQHLAYLETAFKRLGKERLTTLQHQLAALRQALEPSHNT